MVAMAASVYQLDASAPPTPLRIGRSAAGERRSRRAHETTCEVEPMTQRPRRRLHVTVRPRQSTDADRPRGQRRRSQRAGTSSELEHSRCLFEVRARRRRSSRPESPLRR